MVIWRLFSTYIQNKNYLLMHSRDCGVPRLGLNLGHMYLYLVRKAEEDSRRNAALLKFFFALSFEGRLCYLF